MSRVRRGALGALASSLVLLVLAAPSAMAVPHGSLVSIAKGDNGAQRLTYKVGPFNIIPGQNDIGYNGMDQKPKVDGWITRMRRTSSTPTAASRASTSSTSTTASGSTWSQDATSPGAARALLRRRRGEDDHARCPRATATVQGDRPLAAQLHDPQPDAGADQVYMILRRSTSSRRRSPRGARHQAGAPDLDGRAERQIYPVFDVQKGSGDEGQYTYPNDEPDAVPAASQQATSGPSTGRRAGRAPPATCTPAGCTPTCGCAARAPGRQPAAPPRARQGAQACKSRAPRGYGSNAHLFRRTAKYFEPAGAVSWDVAMTGTPPDWRVKVHKGDMLWTSATYDTKRGVLVGVDGDHGRLHGRRRVGQEPLHQARRLRRQAHPRPPARERNHGGGEVQPARSAQAARRATVPGGSIDILDFKYAVGECQPRRTRPRTRR